MLKGFFSFIFLFLILGSAFGSVFINSVDAAPYSWNDNEFDFDLATLEADGTLVMMDIDEDGSVDAVYDITDQGVGSTITARLVWGSYDGLTPYKQITKPANHSIDQITTNNKYILVTSYYEQTANIKYADLHPFDVLANWWGVSYVTDGITLSVADGIRCTVGMRDDDTNTLRLAWLMGKNSGGTQGRIRVVSQPSVVDFQLVVGSATNPPCEASVNHIVTDTGGVTSKLENLDPTSATYNVDDQNDVHQGICGSGTNDRNNDCFIRVADEIQKFNLPDSQSSSVVLSPFVDVRNFGLDFQVDGNDIPEYTGSWSDYFAIPDNSNLENVLNMDYKILDDTITNSPYRVPVETSCIYDDDNLVEQIMFDNYVTSCNLDYPVLDAGTLTFTDGIIDAAHDFDGSTYFHYDGSNVAFTNTDDFTIMFWINFTSTGLQLPIGNDESIGVVGTQGWSFRNSGVNNFVFRIEENSGSHDINYGGLNDGNWHHVSVTYSGSVSANRDQLTGYINGTSPIVGTSGAIADFNDFTDFVIGAQGNGGNIFTGWIDGVEIYDRKLSAAEIITRMNDTYPVSTNQVALLDGDDAKFVNIDDFDFTNKAFTYYVVDDDPPTLPNALLSDELSITDLTTITPSTSILNGHFAGVVGLHSGYQLKSQGISRSVDPNLTNGTTLMPYIVGSNSSQTTLTVNIKNAPSDFSVALQDSRTLDGDPYNWSILRTTADKSFVVDLPNGQCVDIIGRETSSLNAAWEDLGNVCANGVMPKSITYLSNLAFTFWTLPWGTSHSYNQSATSLQTMVRHETLPYSYYVNIYHSNGTLANSTMFTESVIDLDTQTFNTTNVDLPAKLVITDSSNSTLYVANIGYPSYLSGVAAWFNEWFEIDGFNLLYMLPIIFGAMFTRNSVAIGSLLTVGMIALLSWLGLIVVEEIIMYLLVFVAVVGMIAYRLVRG